jgi:hypothetical protein
MITCATTVTALTPGLLALSGSAGGSRLQPDSGPRCYAA